MGAWGVLGHAAGGWNDAHEKDLQRQHEDEQNRRSQYAGFLQSLVANENTHPTVRDNAVQDLAELAQLDGLKKYKFNPERYLAPNPPKTLASYQPPPVPGGSLQNLVPPPAPPGVAAGVAGPDQPPPLSALGPPAPPPSMPSSQASPVSLMSEGSAPSTFLPHEEQTRQAAARAGAVTGAQQGAEVKAFVPTYAPDGSITNMPVSGAGTAIGQPIQNAVPPLGMLAGRGLVPVTYTDPTTGQPMPGVQNKLTGAVHDQTGAVVPGAVVFKEGLLPSTATESMGASGAVTRTHTKTLQKPLGPSAPPGGSTGSPSRQSTQGGAGKGTGGGTGKHVSTATVANWQDDKSPVAGLARDWAVLGKAPKGGPMAERQVRSYMQAHGMEPSLPVPPALQDKIQEAFQARNSAIGLIDDVTKNSDVLSSLISSGKIAIASDPDGNGLVTRMAGLSDKEAQVAGDFSQLVEHANLLRGPLGATGFRGKEAWSALQAQRGSPMGDPRITRQQLAGMRQRLIKLNSADAMILNGMGRTVPDEVKQQSAASAATTANVAPAPHTHQFSLKAWKAANPQGDTAAASAAATAQGFEVVP